MSCNNKAEFMEGLKNALSDCGITEQQDILTDFEEHFTAGEAAGETEAQVCEKLGDPVEIAKQYVPEEAAPERQTAGTTPPPPPPPPEASAFDAVPPPPAPQQQSAAFEPNVGTIVGIICVDLFVFSWALLALASLIGALASLAVGFGVGGFAALIGSVLSAFVSLGWFTTSLSILPAIFMCLALMSASGLLVIATIKSVIGFINIILRIINWHSRAFVNKDVCRLIGKTRRQSA